MTAQEKAQLKKLKHLVDLVYDEIQYVGKEELLYVGTDGWNKAVLEQLLGDSEALYDDLEQIEDNTIKLIVTRFWDLKNEHYKEDMLMFLDGDDGSGEFKVKIKDAGALFQDIQAGVMEEELDDDEYDEDEDEMDFDPVASAGSIARKMIFISPKKAFIDYLQQEHQEDIKLKAKDASLLIDEDENAKNWIKGNAEEIVEHYLMILDLGYIILDTVDEKLLNQWFDIREVNEIYDTMNAPIYKLPY